VGKPCDLFEAGDMFLQAIEMDVAAKHAVVPTLEQDAVIVYLPSNINTPMKMFHSLRSVQLKSKCLACHLYILVLENKYIIRVTYYHNCLLSQLLFHLTEWSESCRTRFLISPWLKPGALRKVW
jgi:hypothetical protein